MNGALFSRDTSFKKMCMFFSADILMSTTLSFMNLSRQGSKSYSVYFGPRIFASSWRLEESVFFILLSLIFVSLLYKDWNLGHSSAPNTSTKAGKLNEA